MRLEAVLFDAMVAPRRDQERAAIIFGKVIRLVRDDAGRRLAGARDHPQVPGSSPFQAVNGCSPLRPLRKR